MSLKDLFVPKVEALACARLDDVASCRLSCEFVMPRAVQCRRRPRVPLRECSASTHLGRSAISSTWQRPTARHPGRSNHCDRR